MTQNILEQMAKKNGPFVPANPQHLLALRIANALNGIEELTRFAVLSEHYPHGRPGRFRQTQNEQATLL